VAQENVARIVRVSIAFFNAVFLNVAQRSE